MRRGVKRDEGETMSLIVTVKVPEGIVMAADSRVSMHVHPKGEASPNPMSGGISHFSDTYTKVFLAPNGAGISFCGEMAIEDGSVSHFLELFVKEKISELTPVSAMPSLLSGYIRTLSKVPATIFHICGFDGDGDPAGFRFWRVVPKQEIIEDRSAKQLVWDGEGDILARLFSPVSMRTPRGDMIQLPDFPLGVNVFTLQDAVNFADFAVRTTVGTMRFQLRPKTVGGEIDLLVLRRSGAEWVRRKTLREPQ